MRVAIVGCGLIAELHAKVLQEIAGITVVACCDVLLERAQALATLFNAKAYADYATMLEEETLDAVHLCTPHYLHVPMAKQAAEKKIAVFTEKPPAITLEEWDELFALRDKIPVGVCFQNRYNPSHKTLQELVASTQAGKVLGGRAIVTWNRGENYYNSADWRGKIATEGGGVLINQAIHTLDLLVNLVGEPDWVEASATNRHLKKTIEVEDTMDAYLGYDDGRQAIFYATTAYQADSPILLEVVCEQVTLRIEGDVVYALWKNGRKETIHPEPLQTATQGKQDYWGNAHGVCIQDFYDSIREKRGYQNDLASAEATMRTTLGIYQSAREHKVIWL